MTELLTPVPDYPAAVTPRGAKGDDGIDTLHGSGPPAAELGVENQSYVDWDNGVVYRKQNGAWTVLAEMGPLRRAQTFADRARFDYLNAVNQRELADAARIGSEAARTGAETARTGAEAARTGAETARTGAETARTGAETARAGAEAARDAAADTVASAVQRVATIATLMSIPVTGTRAFDVLGYYAAGDGGGGRFAPVTGAPAGTYQHNGGTVIVPAGGDGSAAYIRSLPKMFNAIMFGIRANGTDETVQIMRLRQHLIANDDCTVIFNDNANNELQSRTAKWLVGVNRVTLVFGRCRVRNLGSLTAGNGGIYGGADDWSALYVGAGWFWHTMTTGSIRSGTSPNPDSRVWGDPVGSGLPVSITNGHLLTANALAGAGSIQIAPSDAAQYAVGDRILISYWSRQPGSNPPNFGYWEFNTVRSVDAVAGVIGLVTPTESAYKTEALDDTQYGVTYGRARVLRLTRADYRLPEKITIVGGVGVKNRAASSYDGCIFVSGADEVEIIGGTWHQFYPSMVRRCIVRGMKTLDGTSEFDKTIDLLRLEDCEIRAGSGGSLQGTGVKRLEVVGGKLMNPPGQTGAAQFRSRELLLDRVDVATNGVSPSWSMIVCDAYPGRDRRVRNCRFYGNSLQQFMVQGGGSVIFTPDAVTATTMTINAANPLFNTIRMNLDYGQEITVQAANGVTDRFRITDFDFVSGNIVLTGRHQRGAAFLNETNARQLWFSQRVSVDESNVMVTGGIPNVMRLRPGSAWNGSARDDAGAEVRHFITRRNAAALSHTINGFLVRVIVNVLKPYTGTDTVATLTIGRSGMGNVSWTGMSINCLVAGQRVCNIGSSSGAQSGDTLNNIPQLCWAGNLEHYLTGNGTWAFNDASEASLPIIEIIAIVAQER